MEIGGRSTKRKSGFDLLPDDLIIKILSMLPVNPMYKMRFVSKKFEQLLSSDPVRFDLHRPQLLYYTCDHLKDAQDRIIQSTVQLRSINLTQPPTSPDEFTMVFDDHIRSSHSCSGLTCLVSSNHVYVANPTTHLFVKLPERKSRSEFNAFDFGFGFGFGFIPSRNQYQLIILFSSGFLDGYDDDEEDILCEFFTITDGGANDSGDWTIMNTPCATLEMDRSPVCANGVLYWRTWDDDDVCDELLSLELENHQFEFIPFPPEFSDDVMIFLAIGELKGCLCLGFHGVTLDVWLLKDHENHIWVKDYNIDLFALGSLGFRTDSTYCVPLVEQEGELLIEVHDGNRGNELFYYNSRNEIFRSAAHFNTQGKSSKYYVASLFALGSRQVIKPLDG